MKLLLKIAFDGTEFHGYQFQPSHRTVQGTLTETLSELFGEPVNVTGCSRTDSGVHASYFVAAIEPKSEDSGDWLRIPPSKIHRAANDLLPRDISVLGAFPVEDTDFHPRYSVVSKEYVYRIDDSLAPQPFMRNYVYAHRRPISDAEISDMDSAAQRFIGKHDFTSYMAAGSKITDAEKKLCGSNRIPRLRRRFSLHYGKNNGGDHDRGRERASFSRRYR